MRNNSIIYLCSSLERTGPTNQLLNIVKNIKNHFNVTILTLKREGKHSMESEFLEEKGLEIRCFKDMKLLDAIRLIKSHDISHSQGIKADALSALFSNKSIATLRNYPYEDYPALYGVKKGRAMAYIHLLFLRFIHKRVTISDSTKGKINSSVNYDFDVIYNGVNSDKYRISVNQELRDSLHISEYDKTLIYTGPIIERKNVIHLVKEMNNLPNYLMLIVGDGPLIEDAKKIARKHIVFVGGVDNVNEYLSLADAFIMLSKSEGFPNSVLEALSVGLPCILSDIPSHQDVKKIMGGCIYITQGDLKDTIKSCICSSDQDIRMKTVLNLSSTSMAKKYNELYKLL